MKHLPLDERLRCVRDAGSIAVEFWWPFATAHPTADEVDTFASAIEDSGLQLVGLNLFAGDMAAGDRGVLSWQGREEELLSSSRLAIELGQRLGVRRFNALYGNRIAGQDAEAQDAHATRMLRTIAPLFEAIDAKLMIEPVSGAPAYPLTTAADAAAVIERASADGGPTNVGLLLDLYHLSVNGDDVPAAIEAHGASAAHVQIADAPGRGAPGAGDLPLTAWATRLRELGYDGWIALEYADASDDPFAAFDPHSWKELA